jgi:hypothetical protein
VARPDSARRRVMGHPLRKNRRQKERGSLVCSTGDQRTSARQASLPDRGVREKPYAECRLPTRFRVHKFNLLRVQWGAMRRYRHRPQCVCDSEVALWSRDCRQSSFSQVKLSENRRKQFHFKRRTHCVQHRFQRFPTVRTVGEIGNGEVRAKMPDIRACASTAM